MPVNLTRREFLRSGLLLGAGAGIGLASRGGMMGQTAAFQDDPLPGLELSGRLKQVHDPAIIKAEDGYYLFCTGNGIPMRKSTDLLEWKQTFPALVFARVPAWALEKIPQATNIWAPDISYFNNRYHLYYSVSTFGSNRSVIGLVTNASLNSKDDSYKWVDEGLVIESTGVENYNCIDPNVILDAEGVPWLAFGSFWSGLKMRRLDYETGKPSEADTKLYPLAQRFVNSGAVEAPFIIRKNDFYYLFASFDSCCRGADSTYYVVVGRSEAVTGPYVDRDGVEMLKGGGTQVTFPTDRWRGPGHNAILQDGDTDYIVYHAYDAESHGAPTLRISRLAWDADGWPSLTA